MVIYYQGNYGWEFDTFLCNSIMPKITNSYFNCVSVEHKGITGERYLLLENHSNINLGIYVDVKVWLSNKIHRRGITLKPNEHRKFGGLFVGDIESCIIYYIERE